ncbi:MAG TPA: hypothetical protein PL151_03035 [Phycisphaerae bacterium]|nr:hypothetical protein [Phycisphaerae bacterium]HPZ97129.1 hypothetical protein [Phycisphaerae bacterium]HQE26711.1 hypothetical protein [Phycisphaerae bacterium]
MRRRLRLWMLLAMTMGMSVYALPMGCLRTVQQELEVLWAPEANLNLVNNSILVDWFGPGILKFW